MRVFFLERNFYSNPQVILITAESREDANGQLAQQLKAENYGPEHFGALQELDLPMRQMVIISPPGNRDLLR
jgi:hypothetical protein